MCVWYSRQKWPMLRTWREQAAADAHALARAMLCCASLMRAWGFIYLRPSWACPRAPSHTLSLLEQSAAEHRLKRGQLSRRKPASDVLFCWAFATSARFAARDHSVHVSCWHLVVLVGLHQQCEPTSADAFISRSSFTALSRSLRLVHTTTQQQIGICCSHAMSLCSIHLPSALRRSLTIQFQANH